MSSPERDRYIMPLLEIQALVAGFMNHGPEKSYELMKSKAVSIMDKVSDLDEEFMDRSETLLQKARDEQDEETDENEACMKDILYTLSYMMRKLAHEIHFKYLKQGEQRSGERFLKLVSDNKNRKLLI